MEVRPLNTTRTESLRRAGTRGAPGAVAYLLVGLILVTSPVVLGGCKRPSERRKEQARLDSLRNDTARPSINPYKSGQGTAQYNRERENLGNLDSLVTPPKPNVATTPRP